MIILSIQVGLPKVIEHGGKSILTGINKSPVKGPVLLKTLNLAGDGQADAKVHGGRDKALYAYSYDTYEWWKKARPGDSFEYGAFGENLTIDALPEGEVCVGDKFQIGAALVQATQPRFPCYKLAAKFQDPGIVKQFLKLGRPGVYFRVLQEGLIEAGQTLQRISRENNTRSIADAFINGADEFDS